jgi:hypothetical protein
MSNTDFDIPVIVTAAGAQPTPPATLLANLIAAVTAQVPGYTANLPLSLIEDTSSTDVGGMTVCDTARIEAINSISPYGSNEFVLNQLGQIYLGPGAAPAPPTNTSVTVQFNVTNTVTDAVQAGYVIPIGFTVGDGVYQYIVQDGGVSDTDGNVSLFCISPTPGVWPVAPGSVDAVITSVPAPYAITCSNALAGITSAAAETPEQYRARVVQGGQAISQGMPTMLKTLLGLVPGVQQRLISVLQQAGGGWSVIVGGGDPYQVAGAIYDALFDISTLVGSSLNVTNITQANPGVVTLDKNHGYQTGQVFQINGAEGMLPIDGINLTATVIDEKTLSTGINTVGFPPYTGGGVVTPNFRNETPNIIDFPDIYTVPFVIPPQQIVTLVVVWNTSEPNFVAQASVAQAAAPALAAYINTIQAGQPLNLLVAEETFTASLAGILQPAQISVIDFTVIINGVVTPPQSGTKLVFGDPESYFEATTGGMTVEQA